MLYRNQIVDATQHSINPLLNKQRQQKYRTHLNKIFQIQNRPIKSKTKLEVAKIDRKIEQLTKLKQFARKFKARQQQMQRHKNDVIMFTHIKQRVKTSIDNEQKFRKTKSSLKFNSRVISVSQKQLKHLQLAQETKHQNKRLMQSIIQTSFDQQKFRDTLKSTTKDYLKVRAHMRRIKHNKSLKKLKTEPSLRQLSKNAGQSFSKNQNSIKAKDFKSKKVIIDNSIEAVNQQIKDLQNHEMNQKPKQRFLKQSMTQIISKKLKNIN